jgi:hypothetical protein
MATYTANVTVSSAIFHGWTIALTHGSYGRKTSSDDRSCSTEIGNFTRPVSLDIPKIRDSAMKQRFVSKELDALEVPYDLCQQAGALVEGLEHVSVILDHPVQNPILQRSGHCQDLKVNLLTASRQR